MVLNEEQWIKELREKRIAYGISQGRLAVASGITREYLNKIESGKMKPSKELLNTLHKELAKFNPEAPLTMLFDYVKIRFPTLDIQHIIKDILKLNINYMLHEDYGHYSYTEHYSLGDIFIYTSADEALQQLPERKRNNLLMFYFLDMSDTEIAELQHISRAGVFKNRQVALHNMKKILQEEK